MILKVIAIIAWLGMAWVRVGLDLSDLRAGSQPMYRDAPKDWGTPAYYHRTCLEVVLVSGYVLLTIVPNRWLVSMRPVFWVALLLALAPFIYQFLDGFFGLHSLSDLFWLIFFAMMMSPVFLFLPLSLIISFWRQKKGQQVNYA